MYPKIRCDGYSKFFLGTKRSLKLALVALAAARNGSKVRRRMTRRARTGRPPMAESLDFSTARGARVVGVGELRPAAFCPSYKRPAHKWPPMTTGRDGLELEAADRISRSRISHPSRNGSCAFALSLSNKVST